MLQNDLSPGSSSSSLRQRLVMDGARRAPLLVISASASGTQTRGSGPRPQGSSRWPSWSHQRHIKTEYIENQRASVVHGGRRNTAPWRLGEYSNVIRIKGLKLKLLKCYLRTTRIQWQQKSRYGKELINHDLPSSSLWGGKSLKAVHSLHLTNLQPSATQRQPGILRFEKTEWAEFSHCRLVGIRYLDWGRGEAEGKLVT